MSRPPPDAEHIRSLLEHIQSTNIAPPSSSSDRRVLLLADDEMAFARKSPHVGLKLFALVSDSVDGLVTDPWITNIGNYLDRKRGAGGEMESPGRNLMMVPRTGGGDGAPAERGGGGAWEVDEIQVCEVGKFLSDLERGGARAVELLEGVDYLGEEQYDAMREDLASKPPPESRLVAQRYRVYHTSPSFRTLRQRLYRGKLYGPEYTRSCLGMVRSMLKCSVETKETVRDYVELLLRRALRNADVCNELARTSGSSEDGDAVADAVLQSFPAGLGGEKTEWATFEKAARDAAQRMWDVNQILFRSMYDVNGRRNLRGLSDNECEALEEWLDELRDEALERWVVERQNDMGVNGSITRPASSVGPTDGKVGEERKQQRQHRESEAAALIRKLDIPLTPSQLTLLVQSGSSLFNLSTNRSDTDYAIIYTTPTTDLLSRNPPPNFHHAAVESAQGFAADKMGELEYDAKEMGVFVAELCKGNPRNIELLFCNPEWTIYSSIDWEELRSIRSMFLTGRCLSQYYGFVSERLSNARKLMDGIEVADNGGKVDDDKAASMRTEAIAKLLYHAYHKLFDARRIARYEEPLVRLPDGSSERDIIMKIRTTRPLVNELDPRKLIDDAETLLREIRNFQREYDERRVKNGEHVRPKDVNLSEVRSVLDKIRLRNSVPSLPPTRPRSRTISSGRSRSVSGGSSSNAEDVSHASDPEKDDAAALVQRRLAEVEEEHDIRIVYAAELSSRSIGTAHGNSDYDVAAIYVHRGDKYFSLTPLTKSFRETFPASSSSSVEDDEERRSDSQQEVDITLWEIRHAFGLLAGSNLTLLEALSSPIVYRAYQRPLKNTDDNRTATDEEQPQPQKSWTDDALRLTDVTYDRIRLAWNALGQCDNNFGRYITSQTDGNVLQKKYAHVVRKVLLIEWLLNDVGTTADVHSWPPPLRLTELLSTLREVEACDGSSDEQPLVGCIGSNVKNEIESMIRPDQLLFLQDVGNRRPILDDWITERMLLFRTKLRHGKKTQMTEKQPRRMRESSRRQQQQPGEVIVDPEVLSRWDELLIPVVRDASSF